MAVSVEVVQITNFPKGLWRLNLTGVIKKNPDNPYAYEVALYFSRLTNSGSPISSSDSVRPNPDEDTNSFYAVTSFGDFPILRSFSVWEDGLPRVDRGDFCNPEDALDFNAVIPESGTTRKRLNEILPKNSHILSYGDLNAFCRTFETKGGKKLNGEPRKITTVHVLSSAIFQFYYGHSSLLTRPFLDNSIADLNTLIDTRRSGPGENGQFSLWLRSSVHDEDAPTLLRLSQSSYAYDKACYIHRQLQTDIPQKGRHIDADFPFHGETKLRLLGRWIRPRSNPDALEFLALRIVSCNHPIPGLPYEIHRDMEMPDHTTGDDTGHGPEENPGNGRHRKKAKPHNRKREANPDEGQGRTVRIEIPEPQRFADLDKHPAPVKKYLENRKEVPIPHPGNSKQKPDSLSTGPKSSSPNSGRRASFVPTRKESTPSTSPAPYFDLLIRVAELLEKTYFIEWRAINARTGQTGRHVIRSSFPEESPREYSSAWIYVDDIGVNLRTALWVHLIVEGRNFYLLEIERRSEKFALYVLNRDGDGAYLPATAVELSSLMRAWAVATERRSTTAPESEGWLCTPLKHGSAIEDATNLAKATNANALSEAMGSLATRIAKCVGASPRVPRQKAR